MKIYTKTGDKGSTSLIGGKRVLKSELKIESYGTVDELNSWIGVVRDCSENEATKDVLKEIQDRLFTIGSDLASEASYQKKKLPDLFETDIEMLEKEMDKMNEILPDMTHFILPGGHLAVSYTHVTRTICRRAERCVVRLNEVENVNPLVTQYLNRLSDYLFVLSRMMSHEFKTEEIKWIPRK